MQLLNKYESFRPKLAASLCASTLLSGCDYTPPPPPEPFEATDTFTYAEQETIRPGETVILQPLGDAEEVRNIARRISLENNQRQESFMEDTYAPTITPDTPVRMHAEVNLYGSEGDHTRNDASCDVVNLDFGSLNKDRAYLTALALSDQPEDMSFIAWPDNPAGGIGSVALLCFSQGSEPRYGVVLGISDQQR